MKGAIALLVLLAAPAALAYPLLWVDDVLPNDVLKGAKLTPKTCIKHPTTKEKGHGAPTADKAITLTVTPVGEEKPVKSVCPGVDYTIAVGYPEKRRTLLTSSVGAFEGANATCPGRVFTTKAMKSELAFNSTLSVPCNATGTSASLQVTSAAGPSAAFKTASLEVPLAPLSECPKSSCANDSVPATNATEAEGAGGNATKGGSAGAAKEGEAPKAKSAALTASPAAVLVAAACLLAAAAVAL